jgi:Tol biopolymer transport system component
MPDGRTIVFRNQRASAAHEAGPWKLPRLGGQAVTPDSADLLAVGHGWVTRSRGDTAYVLDASSGDTVLRIGQIALAHSFRWRTDGGALAYVVGNGDNVTAWGNVAPSQVWVAPVRGVPVRVTDTTSLNMSPAWLPDGTLLFVSNREGARDIYAVRLDRAGMPRDPPVRLTTGLEAFSVSVSADGRTAAYDRFIYRRNIHAIPIPPRGSVSLREARPITTGNQTIENLCLSADGRWIVFDSNLEGNQSIYIMPAAGGEPRRVTRGPGDDFAPDLARDGRQIAFHSTRNATRDIYVVNLDGSDERRLTTDAEQSYFAAFSPDGRSIAYGNNPSWTVNLVRRDAPGGPWGRPERLPIDSGFVPKWSPDGTRLLYAFRSAGGGIGIYPLGGTPRKVILAPAAGLLNPNWPEWSADGQRIYFRAIGPDNVEGIYEVAPTGGVPRLLVRFDDPALSVFTFSPVKVGNGKFYLSLGQIESDIYMMDLVRE